MLRQPEYHPVRRSGFILSLLLMLAANSLAADTRLSIMSFNIWGGGLNDGNSTRQTVEALKASGADIIGLQEVRAESAVCTGSVCPAEGMSVTLELAQALGYYHYEQQAENDALWSNAILSRYPIIEATPNDLGVRIDVNGLVVYLFNIHATDYPYQPYQLLQIPYDEAPFLNTSEEAVSAARAARNSALQLLIAELEHARGAALVAITGDFNEPSHRDWTAASMHAGLQPMAVPWPMTRAIENEGFSDAYRSVYPNEVERPGFTWSPLITAHTSDDHRDRIDYVFVRGHGITITGAAVVGENQANADIVVTPWPSDHRAVVAHLLLPGELSAVDNHPTQR